MDEKEKKTRFLNDLDRVRQQISEIEEVEMERNREEQILKDQKFHLRNLLEELSLGILSVNLKGIINFANSKALKKLRIDSSQAVDKTEVWDVPVFVKSGISKGIRECLDSQKRNTVDSLYEDEKGHKHYYKNTFSPLFQKDGSINGVVVTIEDVTEERKSDKNLTQRLEFEKFMSRILSQLVEIKDFESTFTGILLEIGVKFGADRSGLYLLDERDQTLSCDYEWHNKKADPQIGNRKNMPLDEFSWMIERFMDKETIQIKKISEMDKTQESLRKCCINEETSSFLAVPVFYEDKLTGFIGIEWMSEESNWTEFDLHLIRETSKNLGYVLGRMSLEDSKRKANNRFCMLAQAGFEAIVILKDGKIIDANHAASTLFEYKPSEYIGKDLSVFFDSDEKKAIEDLMKEPKSQPIESRGVKKSGEVIHVEILTKTLFDENERLEVLGIRDITGKERLEEAIRERYETLKEVMDDTVRALAYTVELKDPFTAGHMERVTRLACSIAEEMGLSQQSIQGLRVAASIHDIGKISIPAEILSKPDNLTDAERLIVQNHPQKGYEILKNINFPWPVADIVLQHHERMNGSGYPSGISGKKILMEARIIGVADVVEALTSSRPHRSAQEKESPINELKKNKRSLYDSDVVDACLKIITHKNFSFQTFNLENS
ncbi:MAG: PAS domain-containing protein [Candidatus Aminicenantes bacterium]